jgi:Na+-transporting NADH:ubiquinone oxidoreductase subunit NqrB
MIAGRLRDPRQLQIAVLSTLLAYGIVVLDFAVDLVPALLVLSCALSAQLFFCRLRGQRFDPLSPLISGLSLCLLLRAAEPSLLCVGAVLAVASKFLLRIGDKHVFNPTTFAIVALLAVTDSVWVSPGQWGTQVLAAAAFVLAGAMVLRRAERSDVTFAFLIFWSAILFGRSLWLGEPWSIPLHRLESGGLLLFAFFMLSDPRTTPDSRSGRVVFAGCVALVAGLVRFVLFEPNALLIALAACAPLVPVLDRMLPGRRFGWPGRAPSFSPLSPSLSPSLSSSLSSSLSTSINS